MTPPTRHRFPLGALYDNATVGEALSLPPGHKTECLVEWNQIVGWYEFAGTKSVMRVGTAREDNILPYNGLYKNISAYEKSPAERRVSVTQ